MGAPYPILQNGAATSQGIWDVASGAANAAVPVGTRAHLNDGRVYYYARSSGAAIVAGNLLQSETVSGDMDDLAVNTAAAGDMTLDITPGGTKIFAANALAGGYVLGNSGTGAGILYKIASNPLTVAATEFTVTLVDPISVSFAAATTVTVMKNPWMDVVISATGQAQFSVGVSNVAVGSGAVTPQYFWCQTWGVAAVTDGDATTIGEAIMSDTTTAGETLVATAGLQVIGTQLFTGVNADWSPVMLQIAP